MCTFRVTVMCKEIKKERKKYEQGCVVPTPSATEAPLTPSGAEQKRGLQAQRTKLQTQGS